MDYRKFGECYYIRMDRNDEIIIVIPIAIAISPCFNKLVGPDPDVVYSLKLPFNFLKYSIALSIRVAGNIRRA